MPNPRFIQQAQRWRNDELPSKKPTPQTPMPAPQPVLPDASGDPFILTYDDFGKELIKKSNEKFAGTRAEISFNTEGEEVSNMYLIKRLALATTIYHDGNLKSAGVWPITPLQSEVALKDSKLADPSRYWEDLALVLYDRSSDGENPAEANALYESIRQNRNWLNLSESDLEAKLIVVNAGLEMDSGAPHGVKPMVLPGVTQVYTHEVLDKVGENFMFGSYGLKGGLPEASQLGSGSRTLYLPDETEDIGLRVLCRDGDLGLDAGGRDLVYDDAGGRVNLAPQGRA